jgi:transcriptional regulator with XRE-family HTH domain
MVTIMELPIAEIIRRERRQRGWDQAELARRLDDVGQQTVSRWERGGSRPQRRMIARLAKVFELDTINLLKAAGYIAPTADTPAQISQPVRPHPITLPLAELAPDRFEQFTADLAQLLHPKAEVHRFGGQGYTQDGIDVLARHQDGTATTFQCKREKQFGPTDVKNAVEAVRVSANEHFLMLTRVASPGARKEISKHDSWKLWDVEDISRAVRVRVPLDAAVRLIDTYFPGWREPFLDVPEPGPWLTGNEFFSPFSGDQLYAHTWDLVGRAAELAEIRSFLDGSQKLATIVGRGGIGKTRLLRAVAAAAENSHAFTVRFVETGIAIKPEHFKLLPVTPRLLIIIDNAHERADIAEMLAGVNRARSSAKYLLSLRPYGLTQLAADLRRVGLHLSDVPSWNLKDLKARDAEALAREILGEGINAGVARRLAQTTADCPLITVVGAGLIKRGRLAPQLLEGQDSIRDEILRAFHDALVADPATGDPELRRAILDAVAILQPVRTGDINFRTTLEKLTSVPFDRIVPHLKSLEDAGILLRRGESVRIVPDLLSDVILAEASFDKRSGVPTGYVARVRKASDGEALQHVFINVNQLDWQVRQDYSGASLLVDALWSALEEEFRPAGVHGRIAIIRLLRKVTFFQPDRTLALIQWLLEHPTTTVEDTDHVLAHLYSPSGEDVLREVPPLLKSIAYNFDYLPKAADLLWELAQRDERPTNQYPEHPMRALTELAGFETGKHPAFNEALIDAAERWLADERVGDLRHSPFDVLEPLLATEGHDHTSDGLSISLRPFTINAEVVRGLRDRVTGLALLEARSAHPRRAVRATQTIGAGLHYPGLFGQNVSQQEREKWAGIFVDTIRQLDDLAGDTALDPVVAVALRHALYWHARYSSSETRDAARQILDLISDSTVHELALTLHDGWGKLLLSDHDEDYHAAEREKQARFEQVATRIVNEYSDEQIVSLLIERLTADRRGFGSADGHPGPFIWTLVGIRPSLGIAICRCVAVDPDSVLQELIPVTLGRLGEMQLPETMECAHELLATDSLPVVRAVAWAFSWNRGARSWLLDGEGDLLQQFARHPDPYIRRSAVRAAQLISKAHHAEAVELVTHVRFGDSPQVADELASTFGPNGDVALGELSNEQAAAFLDQFRECPSIDEYHITGFLSALSKDNPAAVLELLIDRVELREQDRSVRDFRALPYQWHHPLHFRSSVRFPQILRQISDWIAAKLDSWPRRTMGAKLFRAVAQSFDRQVIEVLEEAIQTGARGQIEATGAILGEAPRTLVWENIDLVRRALNAAQAHGEDCVQHVAGALHSAVVSGFRTGTLGEPFSEDVEQRDRSVNIANSLPRGSLEERFYRSLAQSAEQSIRWSMTEDEKLIDGRDW